MVRQARIMSNWLRQHIREHGGAFNITHPAGDRRLMRGLQRPVRSDGEAGESGGVRPPARRRHRDLPGPTYLGGAGAGHRKAAGGGAELWPFLAAV